MLDGGREMKKLLSVLIVVTILFVLLGFGLYTYYENVGQGYGDSSDLIPIEDLTGIYTKATLRPGCYISEGYSIPMNDNGPWLHRYMCGAIAQEINGELQACVPSIKDIYIIDVYGGECTVIFTCETDGERYALEDYPLSNLKYNTRKVLKADDGVKTTLYGSRFTLERSPMGEKSVKIIAAVVILLSVAIAFVAIKMRRAANV